MIGKTRMAILGVALIASSWPLAALAGAYSPDQLIKVDEATTKVTSERYAGKPLLRLLELYVLWSIDELTPSDGARLTAMAPKLKDTFGGDGTWQSAVATSIKLPPEMPSLIRENWRRNQSIAAANRVTLDAQEFAEVFVDSNFAD